MVITIIIKPEIYSNWIKSQIQIKIKPNLKIDKIIPWDISLEFIS